MVTTLEWLESRYPRQNYGECGIDSSRERQATVSPVISAHPYDVRFVESTGDDAPFQHSGEWDVYESGIPQYKF